MTIIDKRPLTIIPPYFLANTINEEPFPLDKGLIGETSICNKKGETCRLEFWGYVMRKPDYDALRKVYIWAKIDSKTAAYAEAVVQLESDKMKFTVDYLPLFPTPFEIAPEFRKQGIKSRLLQVISELALDFHRIAGNSEIRIGGHVVSTMRREVVIVGQPAQFGRWYSLGGRVSDPNDHRKIVEECKKPKKERNWYFHLPYRGHTPVRISEDRLREKLAQTTAICDESCWSQLPLYNTSLNKKQKLV